MRSQGPSAILDHPYSTGVLLAVNAVADAYLLLDAPVCAQWRAGFITGSHDANSTLWDTSGAHRVQISGTTTERLVSGNLQDLARQLGRMAAIPGCGAVLAAGYPLARITGAPYETVWRGLKPAPRIPFFAVTGGAISDDWLDGYAHTLTALARGLDMPKCRRRPQDVAIVGYMHDRGERDHAANIAELRRMLDGVGLNLVSVWPGGTDVSGLRAAASAGTILSLPYGREAARVLAGRLRASLVECGLPLGLQACADWLVELGAATGLQAQARAFAAGELARLVPRLVWPVEELFVNSTFAFVGDPVLVRPLARQLREVGGRMTAAVSMGAHHHTRLLGSWDDLPFPVYEAPSGTQCGEIMRGWFEGPDPVDCMLGASDLDARAKDGRPRSVEVGFASYHSHAFHDRPYLGFEGALCLLSRIAEELRWSKKPGRR
jgi:nitrogenase molybdenum-iron protein alpha/beta subunit